MRYRYEENKERQEFKLGSAQGTPSKYSRRLKRLSLGMPQKASHLSSTSIGMFWFLFCSCASLISFEVCACFSTYRKPLFVECSFASLIFIRAWSFVEIIKLSCFTYIYLESQQELLICMVSHKILHKTCTSLNMICLIPCNSFAILR